MNEKICLICLENIDDIESVVEYNHCGIYYIHNECLNNWNHNECIICRKKFIEIVTSDNENNENNENIENNNNSNNSNNTHIIDSMTTPDLNTGLRCRVLCCTFLIASNFFLIGIYLLSNILNEKKSDNVSNL